MVHAGHAASPILGAHSGMPAPDDQLGYKAAILSDLHVKALFDSNDDGIGDLHGLRQKLGADYVLEGSLRRAGERVRVTAQLIQAVDQTDVWAETYERDLRDVLVLQSEVARAVARAIALTLTPDAQARLASARSMRTRSSSTAGPSAAASATSARYSGLPVTAAVSRPPHVEA